MGYQPFLVANLGEGLVNNIEPWILPENAYPVMENAFSADGVVNKKGGNTLLGRLGARNYIIAVRGAGATVLAFILRWFPIEPASLIISDGVTTFTDDGFGGFTITGGAGTVNAPTNYATGAINITFDDANPGANVTSYYLMVVDDFSPVMGLWNQDIESSVDVNLIAFDRLKAYKYSDNQARFNSISIYKTFGQEVNWSGSNSDFFWSYNYEEALWATNNLAGGHFYAITAITQAAQAVINIGAHNFVNGDRIYIANVQGMVNINNQIGTITGTAAATVTVNINSGGYPAYTSGGVAWSIEKSKTASGDGIRWYEDTGWVNFAPATSSAAIPNIVQGCLMIIPYKGRLVMLNTLEGTTFGGVKRYPQRIRYSQKGLPFVALSFPSTSGITTSAGDAWYETPNRGGFLDAPTSEEIISAAFVKDVLVVFFERSTWRLDFTGSPVSPFIWNRVNSELGSESTFSTVSFDKNATTVGGSAIVACDTVNVERIDDKIPRKAFRFHNDNDGEKRVHGIRDFYNKMALWTYVESNTNATFPNRTLVYNYEYDAWSVFKNYYTTFGYYNRSVDQTWGEADIAWQAMNTAWGQETLQARFPYVVAGNTQGFVHEIQDVDNGEFPSSNDVFYVIQNITGADPSVFTVPNHNIVNYDNVLITDVLGAIVVNDTIYSVRNATANTFELADADGDLTSFAGYTGGGRVTVIDNFSLETKKFNPFSGHGEKVTVGYIDLFLENTVSGKITAEIYHDEDDYFPVAIRTIPLTDPKSLLTNKFWHRMYVNVTAQTVSIIFKLSKDDNGQIFDLDYVNQEFKLHGWILWAAPGGRFS